MLWNLCYAVNNVFHGGVCEETETAMLKKVTGRIVYERQTSGKAEGEGTGRPDDAGGEGITAAV
jgi:hypothetical protein